MAFQPFTSKSIVLRLYRQEPWYWGWTMTTIDELFNVSPEMTLAELIVHIKRLFQIAYEIKLTNIREEEIISTGDMYNGGLYMINKVNNKNSCGTITS